MNPADQRVAELVDHWLKSIELHLKYASLTDEAYWQVQPWSRHQRPARWILDLAHARAQALKRQIEERIARGDAGFGEALELMGFLANLVGVQNIERFIPLADAQRENAAVLGQTEDALPILTTTATQARPILDSTREMRTLPPNAPAPAGPAAATALPDLADTTSVAVPRMPAASPVATPRPAAGAAAPQRPAASKREPRSSSWKPAALPVAGTVEAQIVSDAVRLLKWGRQWHELASAISRIADRPGVVEVRKCLRTYKSEIERAAAL